MGSAAGEVGWEGVGVSFATPPGDTTAGATTTPRWVAAGGDAGAGAGTSFSHTGSLAPATGGAVSEGKGTKQTYI